MYAHLVHKGPLTNEWITAAVYWVFFLMNKQEVLGHQDHTDVGGLLQYMHADVLATQTHKEKKSNTIL